MRVVAEDLADEGGTDLPARELPKTLIGRPLCVTRYSKPGNSNNQQNVFQKESAVLPRPNRTA